MKIIRRVLPDGESAVYAGYDQTPISAAIQYLDHWAHEEASESTMIGSPALEIKDGKDRRDDGTIEHSRTILDQSGTPCVRYHIEC